MGGLLLSNAQTGNKRLLYLYTDNASNPQLLQQQQWLAADKAGLRERDLQVKVLLKSQSPKALVSKGLKESFTLILLGKDGGEKLRSHQPVTLKKLYGLIDAMPMRKAEMKN